jgi:NADH-quinone oxidoreductase subunit G
MCDIGRFDYHWVESDDRLTRPLVRDAQGLRPAAWHDAVAALAARFTAAGAANADGVRFLTSAHASHEELFLLRRLAEGLLGRDGLAAISVGWRTSEKVQPARSQFRVPSVDAPNVNGARLFGLAPGRPGDPQGPADLSALRAAVEAGHVSALYVFDPGPDGSLGDVAWIAAARHQGRLPLLIVHGVVLTDLAQAADFVLPGASFVEKHASYSNDQGRLQGTARAMPTPGEAREDWRIFVTLAAALGLADARGGANARMAYTEDAQVRADIASTFAGVQEFDGLTSLAFAPPMPARTWLQASNPSERWKWDFMFQDVPPVKGTVDPSSLPLEPRPPGTIPLREVK